LFSRVSFIDANLILAKVFATCPVLSSRADTYFLPPFNFDQGRGEVADYDHGVKLRAGSLLEVKVMKEQKKRGARKYKKMEARGLEHVDGLIRRTLGMGISEEEDSCYVPFPAADSEDIEKLQRITLEKIQQKEVLRVCGDGSFFLDDGTRVEFPSADRHENSSSRAETFVVEHSVIQVWFPATSDSEAEEPVPGDAVPEIWHSLSIEGGSGGAEPLYWGAGQLFGVGSNDAEGGDWKLPEFEEHVAAQLSRSIGVEPELVVGGYPNFCMHVLKRKP